MSRYGSVSIQSMIRSLTSALDLRAKNETKIGRSNEREPPQQFDIRRMWECNVRAVMIVCVLTWRRVYDLKQDCQVDEWNAAYRINYLLPNKSKNVMYHSDITIFENTVEVS